MSDRQGDWRARARQIRRQPTINHATTEVAARLARATRALAAKVEVHAIRSGEVSVELPNGKDLRLYAGPEDLWGNLLWWYGWSAYEPQTSRPWFHLADSAKTVLDIGANFGLFALLAGLSNSDARCFAFEPMPNQFAALERNIQRNPSASVTAVRAAVGASTGTTRMYWDPSRVNDMQATTDAGRRHREDGLAEETVALLDIDSWAANEGVERVDLIKIDAEGAEPEVLRGMQSVLSKQPDVVIEVLDEATATAMRDTMQAFGYDHYLLTPVGPLRVSPVAPHPHCLNHLLSTRPQDEVMGLWR